MQWEMDCNEWTITIGYFLDGGYMCVHFIFIGGKFSVNNFYIFHFYCFCSRFNIDVCVRVCMCIVHKREKMWKIARKKIYHSIVRGILQMKNRPLLLPLIWFRQYSNEYAQCSVLFCLQFIVCAFHWKHSAVHFVLLIFFLCFFFGMMIVCVRKNNNLLIFRWVYISNKYTRESFNFCCFIFMVYSYNILSTLKFYSLWRFFVQKNKI